MISTLAYTIPRGMVIVWVLVFALRLVFMLFVAFSNSRLAQRAWPFTNVHTLDPANFLRLCAWALCALLAGMTVFARQHGFAMHIVLFLGWSTCASILLIPLCLLPRNFPTWLDPRWHDSVRKGLVDELGNLLPRGGALRTSTELTLSGGQKRQFSTRITLPLGWQQVKEAPSYLTPAPLAPSVLIVQGPMDYHHLCPPTLLICATPASSEQRLPLGTLSEAIARQVPGWFTLDEITQSKPKASLMCTGTYTDEGVSFTAIQWAWVEKLDSSTFVTMSATATTTTHSFPKYFDEISRMVKKVSVA
ncbi:MAG: hypothetical protein KH004_02795 [Actinomyces sp. oral taxon 181]|nr:hypothetical protein [Actinomyces sp. oral taxon 181]